MYAIRSYYVKRSVRNLVGIALALLSINTPLTSSAQDAKNDTLQGVNDPNWQPLFGGEGEGEGEFKKPVAVALAGRDSYNFV